MTTKYFIDGSIDVSDNTGVIVTLEPSQYANNDIYAVQRIIPWDVLYSIKDRNKYVQRVFNKIRHDYELANGRGI